MKRYLLGPFAHRQRKQILIRIFLVVLLSVVSQLGGLLIWPFLSLNTEDIGWSFRIRRWLYPIISYLVGSQIVVPLLSPFWGMHALPCFGHLQSRTLHTCIFMRNYLHTDGNTILQNVTQSMERIAPRYPIQYLDAGFPIPYVHMLPHLNHSKGNVIDLSFFWQNPKTKAQMSSPSPFGYWGYIQPSTPRKCSPHDLPRIFGRVALKMRWDLDIYQSILPDAQPNIALTKTFIGLIDAYPETTRIILEPHLHPQLASSKTIANTCAQARHDDHFHVLF